MNKFIEENYETLKQGANSRSTGSTWWNANANAFSCELQNFRDRDQPPSEV